MMTPANVVLIECPDEIGIVHRVTGVLVSHGLNIVSNGEFVDPRVSRFFMRTAFEGEAPAGLADELSAELPAHAAVSLVQPRKKDIVILATKEAHCLGDLLVRHAYGELNATIHGVIGNYDRLEPLVRKFDIPFVTVSHEGVRSREEHEDQVSEALQRFKHEYVVLAKYMRILSVDFVDRYPRRMINIHHSFLPAFIGSNPYRQAFDRGVKIIGATAHFVTSDLDEGPIIAQNVIPIDHTDSARDMAQAGHDVEKVVLARALKLVFEDRVCVSGNRTIVFD